MKRSADNEAGTASIPPGFRTLTTSIYDPRLISSRGKVDGESIFGRSIVCSKNDGSVGRCNWKIKQTRSNVVTSIYLKETILHRHLTVHVVFPYDRRYDKRGENKMTRESEEGSKG